jgi:two-component system OmpR family sensor kinase
VARRSVSSIGDLRQAISEKDSGDLNPIQTEGQAIELQPIVHSVNILMGRVQSALEAERAFTANSAHELRTPIAGALAHTQLLMTEVKTASGQVRVEQIEASLQKLKRLVEKLMQLARAEANIALADKPANLLNVLDLLVEEYQRNMQNDERIIYERSAEARLVKPVNEDAFAIVIRNLIENALLHGKQDEPVLIRVGKDSTIHIINGGKSLSSEELANAQKRFGRGTTTVPGSGLGMPIAIEIAEQMHAHLQFLSPATGSTDGFEAILTFRSA